MRRPGSHPEVERIVVGVDGSPGSTRALDWAAAEAERCRARLTVVGAWEFGGFAGAVVDTGDARSAVDGAMERTGRTASRGQPSNRR